MLYGQLPIKFNKAFHLTRNVSECPRTFCMSGSLCSKRVRDGGICCNMGARRTYFATFGGQHILFSAQMGFWKDDLSDNRPKLRIQFYPYSLSQVETSFLETANIYEIYC